MPDHVLQIVRTTKFAPFIEQIHLDMSIFAISFFVMESQEMRSLLSAQSCWARIMFLAYTLLSTWELSAVLNAQIR